LNDAPHSAICIITIVSNTQESTDLSPYLEPVLSRTVPRRSGATTGDLPKIDGSRAQMVDRVVEFKSNRITRIDLGGGSCGSRVHIAGDVRGGYTGDWRVVDRGTDGRCTCARASDEGGPDV
jgi:hypothetical protein